MKTCSEALATYLNTHSEYKSCSLFQISLMDGSNIYATDMDKDVVFDNHTFKHDYCVILRDKTKVSGTPEVDNTSVTIYADKEHNDLVNNLFILEAIHKGLFDTASLTIWRAFFDAEINTAGEELLRPYGALKVFTGRMELNSCSPIAAKFNIKAEITGLNALLPLRTFQAQSSFANENGTVVEYSGDETTCVIPLKPSSNVLYRF